MTNPTMTVELYLQTLVHAAGELPSVLEDWAALELDLCREYADQLRSLLTAQAEMGRRAMAEGRGPDFAIRMALATARIRSLSPLVEQAMGLSVDRLLGNQTSGGEQPPESLSAPPPMAA